MRTVALITCIFFFTFNYSKILSQTKRALIFAIGNYPEKSGWPKLSSNADAALIKQALINQDFESDNIVIVSDSAASMQGIANKLSQLTAASNTGDIVYIHFSSHGEQIEDDDGDETDGLDESVVTYNAIAPDAGGKKKFSELVLQYFRDDQFGDLINRLRQKIGRSGDLFVTMDLCHSGSGTRGISKVRGDMPPLVSSRYTKSPDEDGPANCFVQKAVGSENDLATYVIISAAKADKNDNETFDDNGKEIGSLSYSLCKALERLGSETSYKKLFNQVQIILNAKVPGQQPVLEGNGADRILFGGNYISQKPYLEIKKIKGNEVTLQGGIFSGLDAGAKISIHPAATANPDTGSEISKGIIIASSNYSAIARLEKQLPTNQALSYWAFVTESVYKIPVVIKFQLQNDGHVNGFTIAEEQHIKNVLKEMPFIKFEGAPDLIICKGIVEDSVKIASNGYVFATIKRNDQNPVLYNSCMKRYFQYKFLNDLQIGNKNDLDLQLVPYQEGHIDTANKSLRNSNEANECYVGDQVVLLLHNNTNEPLYVNIIDLQPDGIINPLLPFKEKNIYPDDLKIGAGQSILLKRYVITVTQPVGTEVFKIFTSDKPIDMETIAGGDKSRGNFSVLEKIFQNSFKTDSRGISIENVSKADGAVNSFIFSIKELGKNE